MTAAGRPSAAALAVAGLAAAAAYFAAPHWQAPAVQLAATPVPALAFAASDALIAFDRLHAPMPGASVPIMALYWLGQSGIAASCAGEQRAAR